MGGTTLPLRHGRRRGGGIMGAVDNQRVSWEIVLAIAERYASTCQKEEALLSGRNGGEPLGGGDPAAGQPVDSGAAS